MSNNQVHNMLLELHEINNHDKDDYEDIEMDIDIYNETWKELILNKCKILYHVLERNKKITSTFRRFLIISIHIFLLSIFEPVFFFEYASDISISIFFTKRN